jgi:hypothetical protein
MNANQEPLIELDARLDECAAMLEARVLEKMRPDQMHDLEDWRTYFREARKHPNDEWITAKANDTLIALLNLQP